MVCTFEEYHETYFDTWYIAQAEGYVDMKVFADGSASLTNGYSYPAGTLTYYNDCTHMIEFGDMQGLVSMDGKRVYDSTGNLLYAIEGGIIEEPELILSGGLYDSEGNILADWSTLTETYGLDIEKDYSIDNFDTETTSLCYIINNNDELKDATKLVVKSGTEKIGDCALATCSSLTTIVLPSGITSIGYSAFNGCSNLSSINLPNTLKNIGEGAFAQCTAIEYITIPDSVETIGNYAFMWCSSLKNITIPNSASVGTVGLFVYCTSLQSVTLPNTIETMDVWMFGHCTSLTSINIPESVKYIEAGAILQCDSIEEIYIPEGVETIGDENFRNCKKLQSITVASENANFKSIDGNLYTKDGLSLIRYASGKTAQTFDILEGVTNVGSFALSDSNNLTSVTIPDSVTSIGKDAFVSCNILTNVTFGENSNLTSIGEWAFSGSDSLGDIIIPYGITTVEEGTFNCSAESVTIPNSVTYIGKYAFDGVSTINFNGTIEECSKITFADSENEYEFVCTNGTFTNAEN